MQLLHEPRLILPATPAAADADGSALPAAAQEDAPAFAAVFGGLPAVPPPVDRPGTALAGGGEGVPDTLTGKLLPPIGSPLPPASSGREQALLDAHLPDAPYPGGSVIPYALQGATSPAGLDVIIDNGRLRVAAGDRTDRPAPAVRVALPVAPVAASPGGLAPGAGQPEIGQALAGAAIDPARAAGIRPVSSVVADARSGPEGIAARGATGIAVDPAAVPSAGLADATANAPRRVDLAETGAAAAGREGQFSALTPSSRRRGTGRDGSEARSGEATQRSPVAERPSSLAAAPPAVPPGSLRADFPDALRWRQTAVDPALSQRPDAASTAAQGARFAPDTAMIVADTANPASDIAAPRIAPPVGFAPAGAATVSGVAPTFTVDAPVLDPAWQTAVGERVVWMAARGVHGAELRLNPAELGPMQLQVSVDDGRVSVSITALQAATRDALEAALPRLRELLAENGMDLAGADVSGGGVEQQSGDGGLQRPQDLAGPADGSDAAAEEAKAASATDVAGRDRGAVDLYA